MGFVEEWNKAIASDPVWQMEEFLEDLEDEDPDLAKDVADFLWREQAVYILVINRLASQGIYL